eukprot:scaffold45_cov368-Prasinococcus_capsulatus_cf.AAC.11
MALHKYDPRMKRAEHNPPPLSISASEPRAHRREPGGDATCPAPSARGARCLHGATEGELPAAMTRLATLPEVPALAAHGYRATFPSRESTLNLSLGPRRHVIGGEGVDPRALPAPALARLCFRLVRRTLELSTHSSAPPLGSSSVRPRETTHAAHTPPPPACRQRAASVPPSVSSRHGEARRSAARRRSAGRQTWRRRVPPSPKSGGGLCFEGGGDGAPQA